MDGRRSFRRPITRAKFAKSPMSSSASHLKWDQLLGAAVAPLRDDDVLIVGSGMSCHNLRNLMSGIDVEETSDVFDSWLADSVTSDNPNEMNEEKTHTHSGPAPQTPERPTQGRNTCCR